MDNSFDVFCTNCGGRIKRETKFCEHCGAPVANVTQATSEQENFQQNQVPPVANGNMQQSNNQNFEGFLKEYISELKSFSFEGRLNRERYIKYTLATVALGVIACFLVLVLVEVLDISYRGLDNLLTIVTSAIGIAVAPFTGRRWHDLNRTSWLILTAAIPVIDLFIGIYLICAKGTDGPNQYGPDPLQ